ncbi:MAG: bifunctional 3-deoxy-7-phosphoheptulonate synthase/chorismate mutase [Deinococcota bacterium]|jgi:3-deoxy-7-phosphoheptulonate synthase/chorismate mutase|nr:bifunctional 3-deoxy-7-phosphoheptulonate synthase/chorismate mutase [Deinococcota bacterium]
MDEKIQSLRTQIDELNLKLLDLLSERAKVAEAIGEAQTALGLSHYDPVRENTMLEALTAANKGPFSNGVIKSLFKNIFQASMQLEQEADKATYLTSRKARQENTVVKVGDLSVGSGDAPVLVAGPCSIETWEQVETTAACVASRGVKFFRGGAYKPRTDPYSFQGLGEEGLKMGRKACDMHGLKFITEIMDGRHLELGVEYADVIQIGARNMHNFTLLRSIGRSGKPVILKRGFSATIEEWLMAAEYLLSEGNPNVILCERGIRTFENYTRNTLDISAVALAKLETHLPVFVDVTHSGGRRDLLVPLAKAAIAIGADGIMVEVHPNPAVALSDNKQQIDFEAFDAFLTETGLDKRL